MSIFFSTGKMLIKAPIGSGKSFLFFDGPMYGLYKYSNRNILNTKSKDGYIKVIFEANQETYMIIRKIKKGKVKESCESKLYKITGDISVFAGQEPLQYNQDIQDIAQQQPGLIRDEITFKNETDLQQTLQTILPPREVVMNTIFLMQDSDNIFELTPTERLAILKNVFNLMGIDDAKDILADKKREIRYKIKAITDISKYDTKLKYNIRQYVDTFNETKELLKDKIDTTEFEPFFEEWKMIQDKIQITDFSLKDFPQQRETTLQNYIEQQKSQQQKIDHQRETLQKQLQQEHDKIQGRETTRQSLIKDIAVLQQKIQNIDTQNREDIKQQRLHLLQKQTDSEERLPKQDIWNFIQTQSLPTTIQQLADITWTNCYLYIQQLINQGKKQSEIVKNIQLQIQHETLIAKNEADKIATHKKHLEDKIQDLHQQ